MAFKEDEYFANFEKGRITQLQDERLLIQTKTFTKWCNSFLAKVGYEIADLFTDLADGRCLLKLLEIISGEKLGKPNNGRMKVHCVENVNKSLAFLHTKVRLEGVGAEDIVDGNRRLILGVIWTIILRFQIQEIEIAFDEDEHNAKGENKKTAKEAVLFWCQTKTQDYPGVHIQDFAGSWRNGLGFNALIHAHRPDLVNYTRIIPTKHIDNLNMAFNIAEDALGISRLLDAEDVDVDKPDEISILTYVVSYYHTFCPRNRIDGTGRPEDVTSPRSTVLEEPLQPNEFVDTFLNGKSKETQKDKNAGFPSGVVSTDIIQAKLEPQSGLKLPTDPKQNNVQTSSSISPIIEKYKLVDFIGNGSLGHVFSAELVGSLQPSRRARIALRLLNPIYTQENTVFLREYEIMSHPENIHSNVVTILGKSNLASGEINTSFLNGSPTAVERMANNQIVRFEFSTILKSQDTITCIEMELCGPSLRSWANYSDSIPAHSVKVFKDYRFIARIAGDIISGLQFLHSKIILHRNLKPENIHFSGDNPLGNNFRLPVKIGDFGNRRDVETCQKNSQTKQSFSYLYQARKSSDTGVLNEKLRYDEKSDWFSVGLILYEIFYRIPEGKLAEEFDHLVTHRSLTRHMPFGSISVVDRIILGLTHSQAGQRKEMIDKLSSLENVHKYVNSRDYALHEYLGYGGYGIVFSATTLGTRIATKYLNPSYDGLNNELLRECKLMTHPENEHRNLVTILAKSEVHCAELSSQIKRLLDDSPEAIRNLNNPHAQYHLSLIHGKSGIIKCIEMELCGPNLRSWITQSISKAGYSLDGFEFTAHIARDIISGLRFLHAKGILHRDLKPENIYFADGSITDPDNFNLPVKIGDFGSCRNVTTHQTITQTNQVFSELYRPKEARVPVPDTGKLRFGANADWYSVGLILYEIFYLIPQLNLAAAFEGVVYDRELLPKPSFVPDSRSLDKVNDIILGLTHRQSEQRREAIDLLLRLQDVYNYILSRD